MGSRKCIPRSHADNCRGDELRRDTEVRRMKVELRRSQTKQIGLKKLKMQSEENDLRQRTKEFALQIVWMFSELPKTTEAQVLGKQVLRSGTSVGANYREAYRARSQT